MEFHAGINRRKLDTVLLHFGGAIKAIPGTGDILYSHALIPQRVRANARRKDAPRSLVAFVRRVERALANA